MSTLADKTSLRRTDAQIKATMIERFKVLGELSIAAARGVQRGVVVYGAPGTGKSFEVTQALASLGDSCSYHIHKGHLTSSALYAMLYAHRDADQTLVFDDSDGVLKNEDSLGLLKAALDTTSKRVIAWGTNGRSDGLPSDFVFEGSVIFITNTNFEKVAKGSSAIAPHVEAILSRCLYLDLPIETTQEKLVRLDYVARDLGMLARELALGEDSINEFEIDFICDELMDWIHLNGAEFRELSLRKICHLAGLRKTSINWQRVAEMTILKEAR